MKQDKIGMKQDKIGMKQDKIGMETGQNWDGKMNKILMVDPQKIFFIKKAISFESNLKDLRLTKNEKRLFSLLFGAFRKDYELYQISVNDIKNFYKIKSNNFNSILKKATARISSLMITISQNDNYIHIPIFKFIAYKDGIISYSFNDQFVKSFLLVKDKFVSYEIRNIESLNSSYIMQFYELLRDKLNLNTRYLIEKNFIEIDFKELRKELKIPDSYTPSKIVDRIIEPARKQFKNTDIAFNYKVLGSRDKKIFIRFKENGAFIKQIKYLQNEAYFTGFLKENFIGICFFVAFVEDDLIGFEVGEDKLIIGYRLDRYFNRESQFFVNATLAKKIIHKCYKLARFSESYRYLIFNLKDYREEKQLRTELAAKIELDLKELG